MQLETDNQTFQNANEYYKNIMDVLTCDINTLRLKFDEINLEKEAYKQKYHNSNEMYNGKASALVGEIEKLQTRYE